jgi:hypothetical protein
MISLKHAHPPAWSPYMGQVTASFPATSAVPPVPEASNPYLDQVTNRLIGFTARGMIGFPIGILSNAIFKSSLHRKEAAMTAMICTGIGLTAALLPWKSTFWDVLAKWSGAFTGFSLADMALPKKREDAILAPVV